MLSSARVAAFHADHARRTEVKAAREEKIRQSWIGVMEARLVREELQKCWRTEGVNHYEVRLVRAVVAGLAPGRTGC